MHSTTYRRQLKKFQAMQAIEQRAKDGVSHDEKLREGFTESDRKVAEQLEAAELFRAFLAEEI